MINFIVCDDNNEFLKQEVRIIESFMMNYDFEYKIHSFKEYDERFYDVVKSDIGFKIYFLDIQTKYSSGLDAARSIREEYDDWVSVIIIVTAFNEFKYDALSNRLYLLDFINKLNSYHDRLCDDLSIALKHYNSRNKVLKYEYNHVFKQIEFRHIIYIQKEQDSKRCIIKTTYGDQTINKNLNDTIKLLDERFIKTSRSMIINKDYIMEYNLNENKITFSNGETTYDISRGMKKGLCEYVNDSI